MVYTDYDVKSDTEYSITFQPVTNQTVQLAKSWRTVIPRRLVHEIPGPCTYDTTR